MDPFIENLTVTVFGYLPKPEQIKAINSFKEGNDTILVAPTGFGKSLLYQIAPFLYDQHRYDVVGLQSTGSATCSRSPSLSETPCTSTPNRPSKTPASVSLFDITTDSESTTKDISVVMEDDKKKVSG